MISDPRCRLGGPRRLRGGDGVDDGLFGLLPRRRQRRGRRRPRTRGAACRGSEAPAAAAAVSSLSRWAEHGVGGEQELARHVESPRPHREPRRGRELPLPGQVDGSQRSSPRATARSASAARSSGRATHCRHRSAKSLPVSASIRSSRPRQSGARGGLAPPVRVSGWYAPIPRAALDQTARSASGPARPAISRASSSEAA